MMTNLDTLRDDILKLIAPGVALANAQPEHWICGTNEAESYCPPCARKKLRELKRNASRRQRAELMIDGGWGVEGDGPAFCATCGCLLDNNYTDYGCHEELDYFETEGFNLDDPSHCYSLERIMAATCWEDSKQFPDNPEAKDFRERLHRLCEKIVPSRN